MKAQVKTLLKQMLLLVSIPMTLNPMHNFARKGARMVRPFMHAAPRNSYQPHRSSFGTPHTSGPVYSPHRYQSTTLAVPITYHHTQTTYNISLRPLLWSIYCLGILGFSTYTYTETAQEKIELAAVIAAICPVVQVEALMKECVFEVDNGKKFAYYIDEVTQILEINKSLFKIRYHHIDIDQLIIDLKSIKDSSSTLKIAWKLWDYSELLPHEFWNKSNWERKRLIGKRLSW